jgi:predicted XRE-type DNA-binding protein
MGAAQQEMSQADFARAMNVSRAAVSQWKSKNILREDAFTKPGKSGKVIYHVALEQVRRNRDIGQSLGNGITTRTSVDADPPAPSPVAPAQAELPRIVPPAASPESAAPAPTVPRVDTVEDQLKRARLEEQLRRNRMGAAEEAARQGTLISADDARAQMSKVAASVMQVFVGALPDFAQRIAEEFDVPQRDVLHVLREELRRVRKNAADKERDQADATPQDTLADLGDDAE